MISIKLAQHLIKSTEKAGIHVACWFVNTETLLYQHGVNNSIGWYTPIGILCSYYILLHFYFFVLLWQPLQTLTI